MLWQARFQRRAAEVLQGGIIFQNSGENFEVGDASGEGVGNRLEDVEGNGLGVGLVALGSVAVTTGDRLSLHPLVFGGGGGVVDDEVHDAIGADIAQARTEDNGKNLVLADGVVQGGNQIFFAEGSGFEEFFHQLVVAFRDQLDQALVGGLCLLAQVGGNLCFFALAIAAHFVGVGLHADEIDYTGEALFGADRQFDGDDVASEIFLDGFEDKLYGLLVAFEGWREAALVAYAGGVAFVVQGLFEGLVYFAA